MKPKENQFVTGRRDALKMFGLGSAALMMGEFGRIPSVDMFETPEMAINKKAVTPSGRTSVAFTNGTDRRAMMQEVMKPFEAQIRKEIKGKQIVLKPNMVSTNIPLCATHVDALHGVLEFLQPFYKGQFIIAESSGSTSDSTAGFKNYGYLDLQNKFDIKFVDLNTTNGSPIWVLDNNLYPDKMQVADVFVDPKYYIITVSRLKTHNTVVLTAGVKNIVLAAPLNIAGVNGEKGINNKRKMHGAAPRWLHYNMYQVAKVIRPNFTVIDGVEGMQGNGPNNGFPADHKIALAGNDAFAVDSMCARLMGIPLDYIGYLGYGAADGLGIIDRDKIDIIGGKDPDQFIMKYKLSDNIATQLQWKDPLNPPKQ